MNSDLTRCAVLLSAAIALLVAIPAWADFPVAYSSAIEKTPSVAANSQSGKFLVTYGVRWTSPQGEIYYQPRCQLMNPDGSKSGDELSPFGDLGTVQGLVRPAIVYNSQDDTFFVATLEWKDSSTGARVIGRFLNGDGSNRVGPDFPFGLYLNHYPEAIKGNEAGPIHLVYNSLLNEFVVSVQWKVLLPDPWGNPKPANAVCAKRFTEQDPFSSPVVMLLNNGSADISRHALAYAPVAPGCEAPDGGCYLFGASFSSGNTRTNMVLLLDSQLNTLLNVAIRWGTPDGGASDLDIAFGQVEGQNRFLMVYTDENNYWPNDLIHQWTGVYGIYFDPEASMSFLAAAGQCFWHFLHSPALRPLVGFHADTASVV